MLGIRAQIDTGKLVCPRTHQRLSVDGAGHLVTADGAYFYTFDGDVPILIADPARQLEYEKEGRGSMHAEYAARKSGSLLRRFAGWFASIGSDYRTEASEAAFRAVVVNQPADALCLSIGGGPRRVHPNLVNLNLDRFENVDVVADAYALPYAEGSVDAIHCEAVLEHLEDPERAVTEMFRVLRPTGEVFAATPFLQAFHAYPNHFQNFTLVGHNRLFERAGFEVRSSGTCVGPTFALIDLAGVYIRTFVPTRILSRGLWGVARLFLSPFARLDRLITRSSNSDYLASTVYSHLRKV